MDKIQHERADQGFVWDNNSIQAEKAAHGAAEPSPPPNLNPHLFVVQSRGDEEEAQRRGAEQPSSSSQDGDGGADADEEWYPEGGKEAWLVVLGSWMALSSSLGVMNTIGTFQSYLLTHQLAGMNEGIIGWIFSIYTFMAFFLGIYIGPIFDKYGPRWLILTGTILTGTSLMLFSISTQYWHFLLTFGVMNGFASALMFTPPIAAIGHFFKRRRGFATGVAATGGGFGGIIFPLMLQRLFEQVGFGWAVRTLGFISLALSIASNFLIRSRLPPATNASAHPDFRIFGHVPFLLSTIGIFLVEFALFLPLAYVSAYALAHGYTEAFSFQILTVLNAASVIGRVLPGWYADKIGVYNANIIAVILSIVACFGVWLPAGQSTAGLVIFALMFGFASGSNISLIPVAIGRLCRTQEYGRYYATCYTVVSFACLVGIPIGGQIINSQGGAYWGLIVFVGAVYVGSGVALAAAKVSVVGWKLWSNF